MALITIIIPTYNRASIVTRALDSVLSQTFMDWECFVVDDHSTDNTSEIVGEYCARDNRVRYMLNARKKGAQGARNTGLYASSSRYVCFFDSDNAMFPEFLQEIVNEMVVEADVYKCLSHVVDVQTGLSIDNEICVVEGDIHKALFDGSVYVDFNNIVISREKLLEIGGLDEDCPSLQEFDTNLRLSRISKYHTIQKRLIYYYYGGEGTITRDSMKQIRGKFYNLKKFKSEWLEDKRNADRVIYELLQTLKTVDSWTVKVGYVLKMAFVFPQMAPYYVSQKIFRRQ